MPLQPHKVVQMLELVTETFGHHAAVAGGYPRDMVLGLEPKDVDLWYYSDNCLDRDLDDLAWALRRKHDDLIPVDLIPFYEEQTTVDRVSEGLLRVTVEDVEFDIIKFPKVIIPEATNLLETFDFGICRIAMYLEEEHGIPTVRTTTAFANDKRDRTVTDYRPTTKGRWDRILAKTGFTPNRQFPLHIPETNDGRDTRI